MVLGTYITRRGAKLQVVKLLVLTSKHLILQSQQERHKKKVWNMFEVNNKDARTIEAFIVNFEHFSCFFQVFPLLA